MKISYKKLWVMLLERDISKKKFREDLKDEVKLYDVSDICKQFTEGLKNKPLKKPTSKDFTEWKIWALVSFLSGTGCKIRILLLIKK